MVGLSPCWWLALVSLVSWLAPCAALASAVVVVPLQADPGIAREQVEEATAELVRLLRVEGFNVVSPGQAEPIAETERRTGGFPEDMSPEHCPTPECAGAFRKLFDATFAVQLSLFREGRGAGGVTVALTDADQVVYHANARVHGGDIAAAVRQALKTARAKQADGEGPWLSVRGKPRGALVYVDGLEYGRVPFEKRRIQPGLHRLEVRADRYRGEERELEIPSRIDHVELLELDLSRGRRGPGRLSRGWDWVVGGALFMVGAAHLSLGVYQQLRAGDCATYEGDVCVRRYGDRSGLGQEKLLMGLGSLGMVGGAGWVWGAPIGRVRVRAGTDHALLIWGRSF